MISSYVLAGGAPAFGGFAGFFDDDKRIDP
jgi:hypothetical protein